MATIITSNGDTQVVEIPKDDSSLEFMQKIVMGYIEIVSVSKEDSLVINEEGKLMDLPINRIATAIFNAGGAICDVIVGDVILVKNSELK